MNKCIVCEESEWISIYNNILLRCKNCAFITANLDCNKYYSENIYSEKYFKGEEYIDYIQDKIGLQKNFSKRIDFILNKIEQGFVKNVLEIGAAYGFFGELFVKAFPEAKYLGIDVVQEAVAYGRQNFNIDILCKNYLEVPFKEKFTDVFMWDVIEHLPYPDLFIDKIASEQNSGGRIYITTGDISAMIPKIKKKSGD